jgi:hypothetical protein
VSRQGWRLEVGIAALAAIVVIILAPGLAVVAIIALLVLIACGVSLVIERRAGRSLRRKQAGRPPRPRRR